MDHDGSHFLRRDKRADAVDVVVRSEVFGRHILKRTGMIDARTGDQGIDSAKVVGHAMHHRPYRSLLAHVGRHGNASHPSSFKLSGRLPSLIERTVGVDGHRIAGRGQRLHNNRSDPPCTTGDKGHTAIRLEFRIRCLHGQVFSWASVFNAPTSAAIRESPKSAAKPLRGFPHIEKVPDARRQSLPRRLDTQSRSPSTSSRVRKE